MKKARNDQEVEHPSEKGQTLLEMVFVLPFILMLIMVVSEFGIYFYRSNLIENTSQTMARMAGRGSTNAALTSYMNTQLGSLNPTLAVKNSAGTAITTWTSNQQITMTVTVSAAPVMPISALNIFGGGSAMFPTTLTMRSVKTVYVE